MRFGDHFCAADFYKRGNCRGNWGEIVWDFFFGRVGFLVNGAQRAGVGSKGRMGERENGRLRSGRGGRAGVWIWDGVAAFGAAVFAGSEVIVAVGAVAGARFGGKTAPHARCRAARITFWRSGVAIFEPGAKRRVRLGQIQRQRGRSHERSLSYLQTPNHRFVMKRNPHNGFRRHRKRARA
jgi:hypothetical protein